MPTRSEMGLLSVVVLLALLGLLAIWLMPGRGASADALPGNSGTIWERGQPLP